MWRGQCLELLQRPARYLNKSAILLALVSAGRSTSLRMAVTSQRKPGLYRASGAGSLAHVAFLIGKPIRPAYVFEKLLRTILQDAV